MSKEDLKELTLIVQQIEERYKVWKPLPGPQTLAFNSKADILFYGGAAGGGKTDLMLGTAFHNHRISMIFRREFPQLKGIEDRSRELFSSIGKYNASDKFWKFYGTNKKIEFGAVQHESDVTKYMGRPKDFIGFDELSHFTEYQFRFLIGWLRSSSAGQRQRIICAGNPPTNPEGWWVKNFFGPWLIPNHHRPAKPGELRYYISDSGKDIEVENENPYNHKGEIIIPTSRTFIPARIEDNPFLMDTGYKKQLQALPEPLRSQMLLGDFTAGAEDGANQVIPTKWVQLAQERWRNGKRPDIKMTALGADIARGGNCNTVLTPRYGNWFDRQIVYPGQSTPDGPAIAQLVINYADPDAFINIDAAGVGGAVFDFTREYFKYVYAINNAERDSTATDKTGLFKFYNKRSENLWKFREALDPSSGEDLAIPDDPEILADLTAPTYEVKPLGILIESKEKIIDRLGRSPDKGDSLILAFANPTARDPRLTFI